MTTIQIHLPDELAGIVQNLAPNTEAFIIDLLQSKLKELGATTSLAEEYHLAAIENTSIMKEFAHIDLEGWEDDY